MGMGQSWMYKVHANRKYIDELYGFIEVTKRNMLKKEGTKCVVNVVNA